MSTLLERGEELHADLTIEDLCPKCGSRNDWWIPNKRGRGLVGLDCTVCDFVLDPADLGGAPRPPAILCSGCGDPLVVSIAGYHCAPCGRVVP